MQVTIAGPNTVDIPSFITAIETTAARRPAGMMIVGWDPSAVIAPINRVIESGIPVVCVDGDAPESKRLAFVGTNWRDLGRGRARPWSRRWTAEAARSPCSA